MKPVVEEPIADVAQSAEPVAQEVSLADKTLAELTELAGMLGVAGIYVKDESRRFGLQRYNRSIRLRIDIE